MVDLQPVPAAIGFSRHLSSRQSNILQIMCFKGAVTSLNQSCEKRPGTHILAATALVK